MDGNYQIVVIFKIFFVYLANQNSEIMNKKEFLNKMFKYNGLTKEDVFTSKNYAIITRSGIEKIQYKNKIKVYFETVECKPDFAVIKAKSNKDEMPVETYGSAKWSEYTTVKKISKKGEEYETKQLLHGNTNSWYIMELAEKRALARIVLKVMGLYEHGVFGEDEGVHLEETREQKLSDLHG